MNPNVTSEELPSIEDLVKVPLARHYPLISMLTYAVIDLTVVAAGVVVLLQPFIAVDQNTRDTLSILIIAALGLGVLSCVYQWFAAKAKAYALREHDISFYSGIIFRHVSTQPTNRIQHVEVSQGPIERFANLAKLHIYSAGSAMQTCVIPGLEKGKANQLRQFLLNHVNTESYSSAASDNDELI
ncbi:PH domain-containing protein [Alteromonas sp. ASW11-36]|uniref:PH domain-containing protein n=1 Tax=Alteromonas arenosi TaxID=3055817 RepID=A0ABT7SUG4_9ALTE|nr:PH domain-containing protein [Alteromonas sp. ASW11-36]MDM7859839.1 PH domain-containing protein [Alteromonas sp. ASW11-36]